MAAHPQQDADEPAGVAEPAEVAGPDAGTSAPPKNPFPPTMTVPGFAGADVLVDLAVIEGVVYAPLLDELPVAPQVRQYVTQYCAAWSSSVLTAGKLEQAWPLPPRRVQVVFSESQLHAMLGLAGDERLHGVVVDHLPGSVRFVVESPRLPPLPAWNVSPPLAGLPVSAWYEAGGRAPAS
jgi:hypothetical protein